MSIHCFIYFRLLTLYELYALASDSLHTTPQSSLSDPSLAQVLYAKL